MRRFFILLLSLSLSFITGRSQILPKEGGKLNYRLVAFRFPSVRHVSKYRIEIAAGNYFSDDSFKKNIFSSTETKENKAVIEVPEFGRQYTWRITCDSNHVIVSGALYHFSTLSVSRVDTGLTRLRVIKSAQIHQDAYVFSDGNKTLYNMKGQPIWFLPDIAGFVADSSEVRDLKISSAGTITLLMNNRAYEINYNGDILWQGPENKNFTTEKKHETYHHEFTRLSNGHYMILGNKLELWKLKIPFPPGDSARIADDNETTPQNDSHLGDQPGYRNRQFGNIIEYNQNGDVVWKWNSVDYFKEFDYYSISPFYGLDIITPHENSFYFDEKKKVVYVGFRTINRIVKIKYPEGTVLNTYGEIYKKGVPEKGNPLFCGQHSCRRSPNGYLYIFNNGCDRGSTPKITILKEPPSNHGPLVKIWEYEIPDENRFRDEQMGKFVLTTGGNAIELPDNSLFVSTTSKSARMFIVNRSKEELWSAIPEKWIPAIKQWWPVEEYRASMVNGSEELEQLIWNAQAP